LGKRRERIPRRTASLGIRGKGGGTGGKNLAARKKAPFLKKVIWTVEEKSWRGKTGVVLSLIRKRGAQKGKEKETGGPRFNKKLIS